MDRSIKNGLNGVLFFIAAILLTSVSKQQKLATSREYQIKAIFLYNFAQFIEWPSNSFSDTNSPLIIGILGEDPFGNYLDSTLLREKVRNHPLVVKRFQEAAEVKDCHILFINLNEQKKLAPAMVALNDRDILTVSEGKNFIRQGGIIRLLTENNKIKIQINLEAAKAANLTVSSKLLRLAEIVSAPK